MEYPDSLTIKVTEDHIRTGQRYRCTKCPLALAFTSALIKAGCYDTDVTVISGYDTLFVTSDGGQTALVMYRNKPIGSRFIQSFDIGSEVSPFTMTVRKGTIEV